MPVLFVGRNEMVSRFGDKGLVSQMVYMDVPRPAPFTRPFERLHSSPVPAWRSLSFVASVGSVLG